MVVFCHILLKSNGVASRDLGAAFLERLATDALASRMKRRLELPGHTVTLEEAAQGRQRFAKEAPSFVSGAPKRHLPADGGWGKLVAWVIGERVLAA